MRLIPGKWANEGVSYGGVIMRLDKEVGELGEGCKRAGGSC